MFKRLFDALAGEIAHIALKAGSQNALTFPSGATILTMDCRSQSDYALIVPTAEQATDDVMIAINLIYGSAIQQVITDPMGELGLRDALQNAASQISPELARQLDSRFCDFPRDDKDRRKEAA